MFSRWRQNVIGKNVGDGSSVLVCAHAFVVGRSFSSAGAVMQRGLCFQPLMRPVGSRWLRLADVESDVEAKPSPAALHHKEAAYLKQVFQRVRYVNAKGQPFWSRSSLSAESRMYAGSTCL